MSGAPTDVMAERETQGDEVLRSLEQSSPEAERQWVASRFNARTVTPDGWLLLWNSYSNAFSGFPPEARERIESMLRRDGFSGSFTGLTKYLSQRGFVVPRGTNEMNRLRLRFGLEHYRRDMLDLILLASEDCNFRCVYCYEKFTRGTMEPWVRAAVIRMVERRAPALRHLSAGYFGGEPLLGLEAISETAPAFLAIADKNKLAFSSHMSTNGYLLTPDVFAKLLEWRISHFQITIDGAPEDHDSRRMLRDGGPTFGRILENLKAMRPFREDFRVTLRVNFDQANAIRAREFVETMSCFKDDGRFRIFFFPIRRLGGANDARLRVCGELGPERNNLETVAREMGMAVQRSAPSRDVFGQLCYAARPYSLTIGAGGKVMKCTVALDTKACNVVGLVRENGKLELDPDRFANWTAPHFEDDPECRKCFFLPVCLGGTCPLLRARWAKRQCPADKMQIRSSLSKLWTLNHAQANRYSLAQGRLMRASDASAEVSREPR